MSRTATISKNGTKPGYNIGGMWVWVSYPALEIVGETYPYAEGFEGFMVEVLMNPSGLDERTVTYAWREYLRRLNELTKTDNEPENGNLVDAAEDEWLRVVAPRVRSWNAEQDGKHVPAPGETDDPEAFRSFYVIPEHLKYWVTAVVREISIPKRRTPPSVSVGPGAISTPSATPPDPEPLTS